MKRRNFLKYLSSAVSLPVTINGFGTKAFSEYSPFVQALLGVTDANDKVLVVIQMQGGNDGLNMVIPLDQMSLYSSLRNNIAIPESSVLVLNGAPQTGLHPSMTGLQNLYNEGKVAIVQGVSYPNPSMSHFRSSDIFMSAIDSSQISNTGWAGRYIENEFPAYPIGYPNAATPDPIAIQIGSVVSTALIGKNGNTAVVFKNPNQFSEFVGDKAPQNSDLPNTPYGDYVAFIRQQQIATIAYADRITTASNGGTNAPSAVYPNSELAEQLKIVARLIDGGLQTKIYYLSIGGFDTHANQVVSSNKTTGTHANLLKNLSDSIVAFQTDIAAGGNEERVVGMTFSEFGRRVSSNASIGTDHGIAAPMFVFGKGVKTQKIGTNPNLSSLDNGSVAMQHDFRQVYSTILTDWLGASAATANDVLFKPFNNLPIFKSSPVRLAAEFTEMRFFPNPTSDFIVVEASAIEKGVQTLQLIDMAGHDLPVQVTQINTTRLQIDVRQLPTGYYVLHIQAGQEMLKGKVLVQH